MPWNSLSPVGTLSVKANRTAMNQNIAYIEAEMNKDHFWNVGVNEDGHHKKVEMPLQATDIALSAGMNGGIYLKTVSASNARVEGFYRNVNGIYQFIPSFQSGTFVGNTINVVNIAAVPANSYGTIYIWAQNTRNMQQGTFLSDATIVEAFGFSENLGAGTNFVLLRNNTAVAGSCTDLTIKTVTLTTLTYNYRIVYRGV